MIYVSGVGYFVSSELKSLEGMKIGVERRRKVISDLKENMKTADFGASGQVSQRIRSVSIEIQYLRSLMYAEKNSLPLNAFTIKKRLT